MKLNYNKQFGQYGMCMHIMCVCVCVCVFVCVCVCLNLQQSDFLSEHDFVVYGRW